MRPHAATALTLVAVLGAAFGCEAATDEDDGPETVDDQADGSGADYRLDDQPDAAAAAFVTPEAGDTVTSPVPLQFEVEGVDLAEAGEPAAGEAHLHVLVDRGCVEPGEPIPGPGEQAEQDGVLHFGGGSAEGELALEPGEHELCVQLGDGAHRAFGATDEILVTVE